MRSHPIGTGPFKFVAFKPNESIRVTRDPDYWKPGRPYLDGIDYTIVPNRSTAVLGFAAGKFDLTWPYDVATPLLNELKAQAPQAVCEVAPLNASRSLIVNREVPPFDNPEIRRAMALSLDRKAFLDIMDEGQRSIGGALLPPPAGVWGLPPEMLTDLPGYGPDIENRRSEARGISRLARVGTSRGRRPGIHQEIRPDTIGICRILRRHEVGEAAGANMKHWRRAWKVRPILDQNPEYDDLYQRLA